MAHTILIVDDNTEILEFTEDLLGRDYHVIPVTSAIEALQVLATTPVQLVISDVMMPELDGFEFCAKMKSDEDYCHIPIILLTAKNTLMSRIEGLELGADAYIDKPFSPRHLKAQVANLIANRDKIRTHYVNSPLVHMTAMATSKSDELFLERLNEYIVNNLDNPLLDGEFLAEALHMSRSTLYRKIKSISCLSIHEMINLTRLKKAAALLAEGGYRVFEVSNITGFSSPNHFIRTFSKQFNMSPTAFMKNLESERGGKTERVR